MVFKSKIKWVAVVGLALSIFSLGTHFLLARYSVRKIMETRRDIRTFLSLHNTEKVAYVDSNYGKIWGPVKALKFLRPYAASPETNNPAWAADGEDSNGFLFVHIKGEFHEIRSSICDAVVVARLLNATLVLPELEEVSLAKGISLKFKGFAYIYNEEQFVSTLANDVKIVKTLPEGFKIADEQKSKILIFPPSSASPKFYLEEVLPDLKKYGIMGLTISGGGCLQSLLSAELIEYQKLRCRVAFHALSFRHEIQELGLRIVQRLQALGQPYLAFHTGLERDALAYHGCAELFQDVHSEIIQHRRASMIEKGNIKGDLHVDSELQRRNGSCPLMPEEIGIFLRALGYGPYTRIYLSGSEIFGGQRVLIPLRAMFNILEDRTTLTTEEERSVVYGPEEPTPPLPPPPPVFVDDEKLRLQTWQNAGPRPRPLPPPPGRQKFAHEMEGWWGWVGESDKEPEPTPADLREQGHKLLWAALDYIVCVESNAFIPGFDRDRNGKPNFASQVMGHRAYESASLRTYRPDRKHLVKLLEENADNIYRPKWAWVVSVRDHLRETLGETGIMNLFHSSKPDSFISHPLPECICEIPKRNRTQINKMAKEDQRQVLYGKEACPIWMQHDSTTPVSSQEPSKDEDYELEETEILNLTTDAEKEPATTDADKQDKEDDQLQDAEEEAELDD